MIPDPVVQPTDVGHTAQMYAQACPERIIVNPYMGLGQHSALRRGGQGCGRVGVQSVDAPEALSPVASTYSTLALR